ncbi:MAG TPA: hypothetical protein VGH87_03650, partial [Polyangiaceae bacterium]
DPRMTLARAREKLGGRVISHLRGGEIVRAGGHVGVVLWSDDAECDVWIGDDAVKRVASADVESVSSPELANVAEDARAFAALREGAAVVFDETVAGKLVEKCRWGGLVATGDGRIFAVGFRRFKRPAPN